MPVQNSLEIDNSTLCMLIEEVSIPIPRVLGGLVGGYCVIDSPLMAIPSKRSVDADHTRNIQFTNQYAYSLMGR